MTRASTTHTYPSSHRERRATLHTLGQRLLAFIRTLATNLRLDSVAPGPSPATLDRAADSLVEAIAPLCRREAVMAAAADPAPSANRESPSVQHLAIQPPQRQPATAPVDAVASEVCWRAQEILTISDGGVELAVNKGEEEFELAAMHDAELTPAEVEGAHFVVPEYAAADVSTKQPASRQAAVMASRAKRQLDQFATRIHQELPPIRSPAAQESPLADAVESAYLCGGLRVRVARLGGNVALSVTRGADQ